MRWIRVLGGVLVACCAVAALGLAPAAASSPRPGAGSVVQLAASDASTYTARATFSGPVTAGHVIEPLSGVSLDLAAHGYVEQEFFASGTAHAFKATSSPSDGRWSIEPTTAASYRTRILIRRPSNPAHFSGTVVVEWLNVTAGESSPDWDYLNPALVDAGDAWVGVSAQAVAVNGGTPLLGAPVAGVGRGLVQQEPQRYGSLHHPGDQYSQDIFDQIGLGLRPGPGAVFGPLHLRHIVAVGESQSAFYLTTFADTLQPLSNPFEGIFIHSRGGTGAPLGNGPINPVSGSSGLRIRTDLDVPVFMFETQTDVVDLGYAAAQQPDTPRIRTWEVAGTSHADAYILGGNAGILGCTSTINTGPQHIVVQAAFTDFVDWVARGTPPPSPPLFQLQRAHPATLALDRFGNVVGGVRTPAVDVPVSTLSQDSPPGSSVICSLFGSTSPFSPQMLTTLYGTPDHYVAKYSADLDHAIADRYLLPAERAALLAQARQVQFPSS